MRISAVETTHVSLEKDDPTWHFALGGTPISDNYLVRISTDDGSHGFGSCAAATYYGLPLGGLKAAIDIFTPLVVGRDPFDTEAIMEDLDGALKGHERVKAAFEIALHDVVSRILQVPLYKLIGGTIRTSVPVVRIVALGTAEDAAVKAERLVSAGFRYLKIKLSGEIDLDTARVRAVRQQVGPDVHITADANQTYGVKDAIRAITGMESLGLELIEQPVRATDIRGMREVRRATTVRIEADEAANTLEEIWRLVEADAVDSINLKVAHVGGLGKAKVAAGICRTANVACRMGGGTVGSQIISAATLHFIASTPGLSEPSEVGEWARLANDPASGLAVADGMISVPTGHGLGIDIDDDVLGSPARARN